jgi:hypothetical protein
MYPYRSLYDILAPPKRKIFVSYHHGGDGQYYKAFSSQFCDAYDVVHDSSVDRIIDSDDVDYILRTIRDDYITGTSCTIVLCGAQTPWRKFVDWEIEATLDAQHGLIGVNLPTNPLRQNGNYFVPDRLHDNIVSGYAIWIQWSQLTGVPSLQSGAQFLTQQVELANSRNKQLINNVRSSRLRNG